MKKRVVLWLLTFLAAALISQSQIKAEPEKVILKENYKAGQSFKAVDQLNMDVQFGLAENTVKLKFASGMGYRYTVKKVAADGGMTIGLAIHSFLCETPSVIGLNASFDSTDLFAKPQPGNLFSVCLIGQEIEAEIQPDGVVGDLKFSDAFMNQILLYSKINKTPLTKEQIKAQALQSLGGQFAKSKNSLEEGVYSDQPVKVGESWTKTVNIGGNGFDMSFEATYTLKRRLNGLAVVEVVAKILGVSSEAGITCCNMNGWLKGTITVIEACGWMRDFDLKFAVDGEISPKNEVEAAGEDDGAGYDEDGVGKAGSETPVAADDARKDGQEISNAKFHIEAFCNRKTGDE